MAHNEALGDEEDPPAVVNSYCKQWCKFNKEHRDIVPGKLTKPACIFYQWGIMWKYMGKLHREDIGMMDIETMGGRPNMILPALIRHINGVDEAWTWYRHGIPYREDADGNPNVLPAYVNANHKKMWFKDGVLHRDPLPDGTPQPAVINEDGYMEYWINGVEMV
jgi:hypothetical protein